MIGLESGLVGGFSLLILVVAVLAIVLYLVPVPLWIAAWASGAYVGLFTLVAMRLPVPLWTIVLALSTLAAWTVACWRSFGASPGRRRVVEITVNADRVILTRTTIGAMRQGIVCDITYVSPSLTAIVWKPDGSSISRSVLIVPDMLSADEFRRLRVLLRYGNREEVACPPPNHA